MEGNRLWEVVHWTSDCGLGRVTWCSRYTDGGVESGDALTEATIAEVKVTRVGRKVDQTNKTGNSTTCVSYARHSHDYSFVVQASSISRSSAYFGAGLHSSSSGSYSRVIENDCRSVQRHFLWHSLSRRCSGSSTLSGSLPYLVGRIHLHKRCKHWKSVNWKATYWQGEQHTRFPIGAGKMALQPFEKTSCGASLCQRQPLARASKTVSAQCGVIITPFAFEKKKNIRIRSWMVRRSLALSRDV